MSLFFGLIQMVFKSFLLIFLAWGGIFSTEIHWDEAESAIRAQNVDMLKALKATLKDQKAPTTFFLSKTKKYEGESAESYKSRIQIPAMLTKIGFEGTVFLTANEHVVDGIFRTASGISVPAGLKKIEVVTFLDKQFPDEEGALESKTTLKKAAMKGELGTVLCLLAPFHTANESNWQLNFANGFLNHCGQKGFSAFAQYIFLHQDDFFKDRGTAHMKDACFSNALAADLRMSRGLSWFISQLKALKKLHLTQEAVNELYVEFVAQEHLELMQEYPNWPSPTKVIKNAMLESTLHGGNYPKAKALLGMESRNQPQQHVLDNFLLEMLGRSWDAADEVLSEVYDEEIRVPQAVTDQLFIASIISENPKHFQLITGTYHLGCLTGEQWIYGLPSSSAFDTGLLEAVKYRHQSTFDLLLDGHDEHLSEGGLRAALEQAGKPKEVVQQVGRINFTELVLTDTFSAFDNHYQERLKRKLGIPTKKEELISRITFDLTAFQPVFTPLEVSSRIYKADEQTLSEELDNNDAEPSSEN